jgi:hypothetical protein
MNGMAPPEHWGEVGAQILDFRIPDIQGEDLIQDAELFTPVKLFIVEIPSIQDDGILKQGLDLLFDFHIGLHLVSIGNLPSHASFLNEPVFKCFGFVSGSNFPVENEKSGDDVCVPNFKFSFPYRK